MREVQMTVAQRLTSSRSDSEFMDPRGWKNSEAAIGGPTRPCLSRGETNGVPGKGADMTILYTNETVVEGARASQGRTSDGSLAAELSVPKELGGKCGSDINSEQRAVSPWRLATALACALFAFAAGPADATSPLAQLDGTWSGSGRIDLTDGKSEDLKCTAYYTPKEGGAEVGVALRCASASNKVELRANLVSDGSRVSGSWEERTFNASGTVTGQASATQIKLAINGGGFSGSMAVTTTGKSQVISVLTAGLALKAVKVKLQRD
jgi:hypothetical protein